MKRKEFVVAALAAALAGMGVYPVWSKAQSETTAAAGGSVSVMAVFSGVYPQPAEQSVIFTALAERTGTRFTFDWRQDTDYNVQVATMLASGKLPDLLGPGAYGVMALKEEGAIIPLDDPLDKHGQNILRAVGSSRMSGWRQPDGHVYTITGIVNIPGAYSMMIRKDWLDQAGLAIPDTWDEWLAAWRYFRGHDMNGDGDPANEIPLSLDTARSLAILLNAFGINASADTQFCVYNGRYVPVYEHPQYPAFLTAVQGLYAEGLLDREFTTRTQADLFTIMDNGTCGSTMTWAERASVSTTVNREAGSPAAFWQTVPPIAGPSGARSIQARAWQQTSYAVTTAAEKAGKVEPVVKTFDYLFGDQGVELYSFGVAGKTFDYVGGAARIKPELLTDSFTSYRKAGLSYTPFPGVWSEEAYMQCLTKGAAYKDLADMVRSFYDGLFTVNKAYYYDLPPTLQTDAYVKYRADLISNGVSVLRDRCIAGQISVDEFASQYRALKSRGFQEIIDQGAAAYAVISK